MTRGCDVCGIQDETPRHVHDTGPTTQIRHLPCCAQAGCPSGTCTTTEGN